MVAVRIPEHRYFLESYAHLALRGCSAFDTGLDVHLPRDVWI